MSHAPLVVVAVGGNALIAAPGRESIPEQYVAARQAATHIVGLVKKGWRVVVTHGNGPQVGYVLRRSELSRAELSGVPMDYAGADIQGAVGYMLAQAIENAFIGEGIEQRALAVVTRVEVDANDAAFRTPVKPIGSFMTEDVARERVREEQWTVTQDAGRGWRRVVPSPQPLAIRELGIISQLVDSGVVLIACGGGGIPVVVEPDGTCRGVEAVIDKDLASSLLARELAAEMFIVSTAVPNVAVNYGTPEQEWLEEVDLNTLRSLEAEGHFLDGSMGPKVRAVIDYVSATGNIGVITDLASLRRAVDGDVGTRVVPS
jgi:carbamate kinase